MAKTTITLTVDSEHLRAMEVFLRKENSSVQKKMDEALAALFEQAVPEPVREYLGGIGVAKPKRPAALSRTAAPPKSGSDEKKAAALIPPRKESICT